MAKNTQNTQNTAQTQNNQIVTPMETMQSASTGIFSTDTLLADCETEVAGDVVEYRLTLKGKGDTEDCTITDQKAIEAIKGIQLADKLEKYVSFRKGAFLVQLVDSTFMKNNDIKSVAQLAKNYELGVETSTANALETVARRLCVSFDNDGKLHLADESLPVLSFWHYSQVISLVTQDSTGNWNYDSIKDFFKVAQVTPIMSQKRLKELFNEYRNGRLTGKVALPDSVTEKANKDAKRVEEAEAQKRKAEEAKRVVSATVALEKAEDFTSKQAVALSALDALTECLQAIGVEYDASDLRGLIADAEPPKATPKDKDEE